MYRMMTCQSRHFSFNLVSPKSGSMIVFRAGKGYRNLLDRNTRFSNFLRPRILKICYRSKYKSAEKLLEEVDGYGYGFPSISNRPKVHDKVSVLMGYDDLSDFVENKDGTASFDASIACKRFPSIIVGSSPPVTLYDGTREFCDVNSLLAPEDIEDLLCSSTNEDLTPNGLRERWDSSDLSISSVETSSTEPHSCIAHSSFDPLTTVADEKLIQQVAMDYFNSCESHVDATPNELFLDKAISCIAGLKPRHCRQLEESGFPTLRKLLHHFPRTYSDLQNAQTGIEEGQYFISTGKIVSSRGVRDSCSVSYLEVVVSCEIAESESNPKHIIESADNKGNKTIFLHMMRFFRGTRFTSKPFLQRLQETHKEGAIVCVTGKVRSLAAKNHYEIREYTIDIIQDENNSSFYAKGRPYPIYPAKRGSTPNFLRDIMTSALQALPLQFDPIPKNVLQDFGLPSLNDAYNGIHQPKSTNEAGLARRRFIFDEFFYLQIARLMVVMNAERFGIAQLHQLRGRVGHGSRKSKCISVASSSHSLNRLKVLGKSSDGFHLANVDLVLRGPGSLLGKKQSGHLQEFPVARLEVDGNILQEAHLAALKILGASHDLEKFPLLKMELSEAEQKYDRFRAWWSSLSSILMASLFLAVLLLYLHGTTYIVKAVRRKL